MYLHTPMTAAGSPALRTVTGPCLLFSHTSDTCSRLFLAFRNCDPSSTTTFRIFARSRDTPNASGTLEKRGLSIGLDIAQNARAIYGMQNICLAFAFSTEISIQTPATPRWEPRPMSEGYQGSAQNSHSQCLRFHLGHY